MQEQCITRVGGNKAIPIDVRVIPATNRNLQDMIEKGNFRSHLYYRLSVVEIPLPPLRERGKDILTLAEYFNQSLSKELKLPYSPLSTEVQDCLLNHTWPGNVRELRNLMEKMLIWAYG